MKKIIVTEFDAVNNPYPSRKRELREILDDIKNGCYAEKVNICRNALNKEMLESAKRNLPLFTPTGIFNYRSISGMEKYNGFMCLDIDHIENPEELKEKCKKISFVYAAFISPSGKGLKVLVKTNATRETYKEIESKLAMEFEKLTGAKRDNHCKDIARVQYVSYDPKLYINENSSIFK